MNSAEKQGFINCRAAIAFKQSGNLKSNSQLLFHIALSNSQTYFLSTDSKIKKVQLCNC